MKMSKEKLPRFYLMVGPHETCKDVSAAHAISATVRERMKQESAKGADMPRMTGFGATETGAVEDLQRRISRSVFDAEYIYKMDKACKKWIAKQSDVVNAKEANLCGQCGKTLALYLGIISQAPGYIGKRFCSEKCLMGFLPAPPNAEETKDAAPEDDCSCGKCGKNLIFNLGAAHTMMSVTKKSFCSEDCLRAFVNELKAKETKPAKPSDTANSPEHISASFLTDEDLKNDAKTVTDNLSEGFALAAFTRLVLGLTGRAKDAAPETAKAEWFTVTIGGRDTQRAEVPTHWGTVYVSDELRGRELGIYDGVPCYEFKMFWLGEWASIDAPKAYKSTKPEPFSPAEVEAAARDWAESVSLGEPWGETRYE